MDETDLRVSAPANLLLLGEYAVLEEGGLGLAVAPDARARGVAHARSGARGLDAAGERAGAHGTAGPTLIRGVTPLETLTWPGDTGILGGVAARLTEALGRLPAGTQLEIDTRALFRPDGRKRGFGSSAALTVVLTALWRRLAAGGEGGSADEAALVELAVEAHRAAQGGRGSGYDVATSATGGLVLFTGGARPSVRRVELPWLPPLALFPGPDPVATGGAVSRYRDWASANPGDHAAFVRRSNGLVDSFVRAGSWEAALPLLLDYRALALNLGERIGVSARMEPSASDAPGVVTKAVGAGNELGVAFLGGTAAAEVPHGLEPLPVSAEGVRWE